MQPTSYSTVTPANNTACIIGVKNNETRDNSPCERARNLAEDNINSKNMYKRVAEYWEYHRDTIRDAAIIGTSAVAMGSGMYAQTLINTNSYYTVIATAATGAVTGGISGHLRSDLGCPAITVHAILTSMLSTAPVFMGTVIRAPETLSPVAHGVLSALGGIANGALTGFNIRRWLHSR